MDNRVQSTTVDQHVNNCIEILHMSIVRVKVDNDHLRRLVDLVRRSDTYNILDWGDGCGALIRSIDEVHHDFCVGYETVGKYLCDCTQLHDPEVYKLVGQFVDDPSAYTSIPHKSEVLNRLYGLRSGIVIVDKENCTVNPVEPVWASLDDWSKASTLSTLSISMLEI